MAFPAKMADRRGAAIPTTVKSTLSVETHDRTGSRGARVQQVDKAPWILALWSQSLVIPRTDLTTPFSQDSAAIFPSTGLLKSLCRAFEGKPPALLGGVLPHHNSIHRRNPATIRPDICNSRISNKRICCSQVGPEGSKPGPGCLPCSPIQLIAHFRDESVGWLFWYCRAWARPIFLCLCNNRRQIFIFPLRHVLSLWQKKLRQPQQNKRAKRHHLWKKPGHNQARTL